MSTLAASQSSTSASNKGLVIVTGASSGIGAAVAKRFSAAGHPLLLLARRVDRMEALGLPNALCEQVDVTNPEELKRAVEKAELRFGPASLLVNNAGVMLLGSTVDQDAAEWAKMINVNVFGVLNGVKAVLAGMLKRRKGTIVNVTSIADRKLFPNHAVYCATKYAVKAFTEGVRMEASASGVRCIVVAPGVVETELLSHTTSAEIKSDYNGWKEGELQGQPLRPEDIADCVFFANSMPAHVTVRELVVGPTFQKD